MNTAGRIGSRDMYRGARNSIARFVDPELKKMKTRKGPDKVEVNISWYEVSSDWVKKYYAWLLKQTSPTTASIYLRHLRAAFNRAIDLHIVKGDVYPFGKHGVKIPTTSARKIALSEIDKNRLLELKNWSVDFWALSYYCYGLNILDLALLTIADIRDDLIIIKRQKSKNTGKVMVIPIRQEVKDIISRHGNKSLNPADYVFPILSPGLTPNQIKNRVKDFVRKVNEGLREARKKLELTGKLTTYSARHTFANIALQKGASKEFIQEALGHSSMMTTENYLAGFDIETKRAISAKL
jgi:integrase/recombinase XerD